MRLLHEIAQEATAEAEAAKENVIEKRDVKVALEVS